MFGLEFLQNISYIQETTLVIPLWQMGLFILLMAFCLLFRRFQLGLSIAFIFSFYWGFIFNQNLFFANILPHERFSWPFLMYVGSGFTIILLSVVSFFSQQHQY